MTKQNDEKKPVPVNVDEINLDLLKLKVADMPSLMEYAHTVGGFAITPTNEGAIKSNARSAMVEQTEEQLKMIFEQMQTLAKQVQDIKKRVYISDLIYNVHIPFTPVIGKTYYLYEENASKRFLSLLSPEEWGERNDQTFLAEIKLNADHTWKVMRSTIEFN